MNVWMPGEAPIQAVRLVRDGAGAGESTVAPGAGWWVWVGVAVCVLVVGVVVRGVVMRRSEDVARGAFRRVASRLRLGRGEREMMEAISGGVDSSAVALLLSQDAFVRRAEAVVRAGRAGITPEAVVALHRKVFAAGR